MEQLAITDANDGSTRVSRPARKKRKSRLFRLRYRTRLLRSLSMSTRRQLTTPSITQFQNRCRTVACPGVASEFDSQAIGQRFRSHSARDNRSRRAPVANLKGDRSTRSHE